MRTLSQSASVYPTDDRNGRTKPVAGAEFTARAAAEPEEVLVRDARAGLSPSQMVERKLLSLLNGRPLPASQVMMSAARRPARSAGV
jgi:hypothetical protein